MIKISVIIPVFNTEKYLKECLDSVINQSLRDIEIICINDGSSDKSFEILTDYESGDNRFKIINQTNKGLSESRNIGIKHSTGEYILFLDSDDYLELNALNNLYDIATSKNSDLILFKIINFSNEEFRDEYFDMQFLKEIIGDNTFNWMDVKDKLFDISVTAPGKLFKRKLIENIEFPKNLIFEDNLFFIKTIFNAKKVFFYDEYLYHRRIRKNSITNSNFEKYSDVIEIFNLIEEYIKSIGYHEEFKLQLFYKKTKNIFDKFSKVDKKNKEKFFNLIKKDFIRYNDVDLSGANKRSLFILHSALNSNNSMEFENKINQYDAKIKNKKLQSEINTLKNSNSRKITKPIRKFFKYFIKDD